MNAKDLIIGESGTVSIITAAGRANFEYAVPIRTLISSTGGAKPIRVNLKECTAMDSTFMGVLTMGALEAEKHSLPFEIYNASAALKHSLADLGVEELFVFKMGDPGEGAPSSSSSSSSVLETAETVAEAHRKLVEADSSNEAKFSEVIKFADEDVERLKKNGN